MNEPAAALEFLGTVELQIPSKPEWVAVARLAISGLANRSVYALMDGVARSHKEKHHDVF